MSSTSKCSGLLCDAEIVKIMLNPSEQYTAHTTLRRRCDRLASTGMIKQKLAFVNIIFTVRTGNNCSRYDFPVETTSAGWTDVRRPIWLLIESEG